MAEKYSIKASIVQRDFLAVFVVVVNAFSWYFPLYVFFEHILRGILKEEFTVMLLTFSIYYLGIICFAIASAVLFKKLSRSRFLSLWMLIGVIASASMILLETNDITAILLVSLLLGISLGLGFPSCLAYFGSYGVERNRGRLGGITWFASGLCMLMLGLLISQSPFFAFSVLILTVWRGLGLILFLLIEPLRESKENVADVPYKSIILNKSFSLYLVPWIMFCLVNFLERPVTSKLFGESLTLLVPVAEFGIGGFAALVGGWLADAFGRKRVIISGFIMLGIGYAVLGLFPQIDLSWYSHIVLDGIAWGIFALMFYLVIWSDLAGNKLKEKYYLIGVLPFLISSYIQVLFTEVAKGVDVYSAPFFSLASFFLFLAVLPLMYAPETLPEKEIEQRRLMKYLEDAEKVKKKYEKGQ